MKIFKETGQSCPRWISGTRTYFSYRRMMERCYQKDYPTYHRYGGRGITVCERWRTSIENFVADMGMKPRNKTLGRINNDLGYSPENCEWQTVKEQSQNRGTCHYLEFSGRKLNITQWSNETGIPYRRLMSRIQRGWTAEEALTT